MFDIVGVGFGPSNLSIAAATQELDAQVSMLFLEKKEAFSWHPGMLLPDTEMQISFLKDIATLRNPSSPYTFLNYLQEHGRLASFVNLKTFYPSRIEFSDYFAWVAKKLRQYVRYNSEVLEISPVDADTIQCLKVIFQDASTGERHTVFAKNVVIAVGGSPTYPIGVDPSKPMQRIWHNAYHLERIQRFKQISTKPYHFVVVGRGQSAAEVSYDLYREFPQAKISCIHRNFGYKPADESPFSNEIFDADFVDTFYQLPAQMRSKLLDDYADTNYAVADMELIQQLYKIQYDDSLIGRQRLCYRRFSTVTHLEEAADEVKVHIDDRANGTQDVLSADAVILATGYTFQGFSRLLKPLKNYLNWHDDAKPLVERYYRLSSRPELSAGIYLQGANESSHGLTDTLLSINALRAQEIVQDILNRTLSAQSFDITKFSNQEASYA